MKNTDTISDSFLKHLHFLYTTVTSISSNPDKNEFIVADSAGRMSHFKYNRAYSISSLETLKLNKIIDAHKNAIYSTIHHENDFFTYFVGSKCRGSVGCAKRWSFIDGLDNLVCEYKFAKNFSKVAIKPYINDMTIVKNYLVSATCKGLENFDLETNKKMFPEHFEKYINCLAVDDCGCIVCGGGPQLSMWHMSTKTKIFTFEISPNTKPCTINIHNHKILVGTSSGRLLQFDYLGTGTGSIDTSLLRVNVLHPIQRGQYTDCYFLAGRLPEIHVYTHNLQHVDTIYLPSHADT